MNNFDLTKFLTEGKLYENEEQGYTLYTTNVEYDNGKTGYMYQLVNSEDGEENEIGFDQLYFVGKGDASDPRVFIGKDFKDFDQGSYQEEEVSAEEAMKMYKSLAEGKLSEELGPKGESTTFSVDYRGEPYTIEWYKQDQGYAKDRGERSVYAIHQVYTPEGDVVDWDTETYEEFMDMFASQYPEFTGSDLAEPSIEENKIKETKSNKMKKSELKEIIKAAMLEGDNYYEDSVKEAEDVEVEDNENIDVDIEKDIKIDDEESEVDIDVKASMPGESEDVEEVQALLMKAQQAATDLGDEKLTDQIGNTITYFTRAHVARVDEADLDMELDPTAVTKINPEAAAVIGLDEKKQGYNDKLDDAEGAKHGKKKQDMKQRRADSENMEKADGKRKFAGDSKMDKKNENLNESVEAFPLWNRIK